MTSFSFGAILNYKLRERSYEMSTNLKGLKGVTGLTGEVSMVSYFGGVDNGNCVQLTFQKPEFERDKPDFGYWYLQLTKEQARELAVALNEYADGTREEDSNQIKD